MSSDATRDQDAPVPTDEESAHDLVLADLRTRGDLTPALQADLEARKALGLERYGTILQPHNGRDSLVDAYQEALDLVAYLRNEIQLRASLVGDHRPVINAYHAALDLLTFLRRQLP